MSDLSKMPSSGACPFCGRAFSVDWTGGSGPMGDVSGALFHERPLCKKFEELTGDEFVQAVLDGKHKS